jgi:hypothetical protein
LVMADMGGMGSFPSRAVTIVASAAGSGGPLQTVLSSRTTVEAGSDFSEESDPPQ